MLAGLVWLARRHSFGPGHLAALVPATLLCTPYLWDYDLVCLGVSRAWIFGEAQQSGWRRWEKLVLCGAYVLPVVSRVSGMAWHLPLAPFVPGACWP